MYNNKGRGFVGFRKIYTEDVVQKQRSAVVFEQKFPLVSQAVCTTSQISSESYLNLTCGNGNILSEATATFQCNGAACNTNNPAGNTVYRVTSDTSTSVSRDLTTKALVSASTVTRTFDGYGNVLTENTAVIDRNDLGQVVRTSSVGTTNVYDYSQANYTNFWINKLVGSETVVTQSYGVGHPGILQTPPDRKTSSRIDYHNTLRQPNCVATFAGSLPTGTCASSVGAEKVVTTTFDDQLPPGNPVYGNAVAVGTSARAAGTRSVGTNYGPDGYFPVVLTDANAASVTQVIDPKFGTPTQVTDANGLTTTTQYDAMGRAVRTVAPSKDGLSAGMPVIVSYETCASVGCPLNNLNTGIPMMRVVTSQYGGSQSVNYIDSLGRTILSANSLMAATRWTTPANVNLSTASVVNMNYDARGLIKKQYEPSLGGPNAMAYTEMTFDDLGRPVTKLQRFNAVHEDALPTTDNFRRTEYAYNGLKTDIKVCQVLSAGQNGPTCIGTGANNFDGSPQLSMSRSFDSAGKLLSTTDANGKVTRYWFDGAGNPLQITDVMGLTIKATYNDFGYRLDVEDPDRGKWFFTYNGYGEVTKQTDARGQVTNINYDNLGRAISKTWKEFGRISTGTQFAFIESTAFENSTSSGRYGTVTNVVRDGGPANTEEFERWRREFTYDSLNRVTSARTTMQMRNLEPVITGTETRFDRNFGRVKHIVYPTSAIDSQPVSIYQAYNSLGMMVREGFYNDYVPNTTAQPNLHIQTSPAIRTTEAQDGRGLTISEYFGATANNGSVDWRVQNLFDSSGWLLAQCVNTTGGCSSVKPTATTNQPLDERYRFDVYGNLKKQWHNGSWMSGSSTQNNGIQGLELYEYDALQRLTKVTRTKGNGVTDLPITYAYDDIGNLQSKSDFATNYNYIGGTHKVASVSGGPGGAVSYAYEDFNGNVTKRTENGTVTNISYDVMNLPRRMQKGTTMTADFYEGQSGRFAQRLVAGSSVRDTYYLDKAYEREVNNNQASTERYYLTSGALLVVQSGGRKLNYLHQDRLGSPVSITEKSVSTNNQLGNASVALVEHRGFDSFGKALDGQWGTSNNGMLNLLAGTFNQNQRNQRGFTGHEHLDEFALIHMNGRAYDYNLGRFYGVDPFVQFPSNSQSLNPYSYLMNNPLAGTDPTGYLACTQVDSGKVGKGSCDHQLSDGKTVSVNYNIQKPGVVSVKTTAATFKAIAADNVKRNENGAANSANGTKNNPSEIGKVSDRPRNVIVGDQKSDEEALKRASTLKNSLPNEQLSQATKSTVTSDKVRNDKATVDSQASLSVHAHVLMRNDSGELKRDVEALKTNFLRILPTAWRPDGKTDADLVDQLRIPNYTRGTDGVLRVVERVLIPFGEDEAKLYNVRTVTPGVPDAFDQQNWQPGRQNLLSSAQQNAIRNVGNTRFSLKERTRPPAPSCSLDQSLMLQAK